MAGGDYAFHLDIPAVKVTLWQHTFPRGGTITMGDKSPKSKERSRKQGAVVKAQKKAAATSKNAADTTSEVVKKINR
jgi:hypothetical protein